MKKLKILFLITVILTFSVALFGEFLDKMQKIDNLMQQGKYEQAEKEASLLLNDANITDQERGSVQNILSNIKKKKSEVSTQTQSQTQSQTQTSTSTSQSSTSTVENTIVDSTPGIEVQVVDNQNQEQQNVSSTKVDTGTLPASNEDVSDGSKFETYDNYEYAISSDPNATAIFRMCNLYFKDGLYQRAAELAKKDKSRDIRNLFVVAIASRLQGDFDESIKYYNDILAILPNASEAKLGLGIAYKSKGEFEKALPYLQAYVKNHRDEVVRRDIVILTNIIRNK